MSRLKELEEEVKATARHRGRERGEAREGFGLDRAVSCRSGHHWWRTKLDLGSSEPLDNLHCSSTLGDSDKDQECLRWRKRVLRRALLGLRPATAGQAAEAWCAAGWPGNRSDGCARSLGGGCVVRSDAGTCRPTGSWVFVDCGEPNRASEK